MENFDTVAKELFSSNTQGLSAGQMNARILSGAARLSPIAKDVESKGSEVSSRIAEMDVNLRGTVAELRAIDHDFSAQLLSSLLGPNLRLDNAEETFGNIDDVLMSLRGVSVMSSALRKVIRPAVNGIQALRTAFATFASWSDL